MSNKNLLSGRDKELLAACKDIDEGRVVIAKD